VTTGSTLRLAGGLRAAVFVCAFVFLAMVLTEPPPP
jgi:hypothetical protein